MLAHNRRIVESGQTAYARYRDAFEHRVEADAPTLVVCRAIRYETCADDDSRRWVQIAAEIS